MTTAEKIAEPTAHDCAHEHAAIGHVLPASVLLGVFGSLIALTWLTVYVTNFDLGALNFPIAMAIAVVKASLVALYFMHLRYDHPFHGLIFVAALLFVGIFLSLTIMDSLAYQPDIQTYQQDADAAQ